MNEGDRVYFLDDNKHAKIGILTIEKLTDEFLILKNNNEVLGANKEDIDIVDNLDELDDSVTTFKLKQKVISNKRIEGLCEDREVFEIMSIKISLNKFNDIYTIKSESKTTKIKLIKLIENFIVYDIEYENKLGKEINPSKNRNYFLVHARMKTIEQKNVIIKSIQENEVEVYDMNRNILKLRKDELRYIQNQEELISYNKDDFIYKDLKNKIIHYKDDIYIVKDINSIYINSLEDIYLLENVETKEKINLEYKTIREEELI